MQTAVLMLIGFAVAAQVRPNFSGWWQLNLEKSTFRGPAPKALLVEIEHRDPHLIQTCV